MDWSKKQFGKIGHNFFSGGTPGTRDRSLWSGDIPWITSKWLRDSIYLNSGEKCISKKGLENSSTKIVPKRSLIFATRVGVGKVCINNINLAINQDLLGIEIDEDKYSLEFLAYQLRYEPIQNHISTFKRGATIQGITRDSVCSIELNIPPLPEQRKIAYILSTIQKAIEQQDKLILVTKELKKALMQKLFTEGTRGEKQKQTEIGPVPKSWEVKTIHQITTGRFQNGAFVQNPIKGNGLLFANVVDMYRGIFLEFDKLERYKIREDDVKQYLLSEGDILFVRSSLKREGIGQNCVVRNITENIFYDCHIIKITPDVKNVIPEFMSYYFSSPLGKDELIKRSKTTTMTTINQVSLGSTQIPLPSIDEQKMIVAVLLSFDKKLSHLNKNKGLLNDLFRTLLHELMTGQRRVHEIDFDFYKKDGDYETK